MFISLPSSPGLLPNPGRDVPHGRPDPGVLPVAVLAHPPGGVPAAVLHPRHVRGMAEEQVRTWRV